MIAENGDDRGTQLYRSDIDAKNVPCLDILNGTRSCECILVTGPSGVGKSTFVKRIVERYPQSLERVVSFTTRPKRSNERDGVDYHFMTGQQVRGMGHKVWMEQGMAYLGKKWDAFRTKEKHPYGSLTMKGDAKSSQGPRTG